MKRWLRNALILLLIVLPVVVISLEYVEDIAEGNDRFGTQAIAFITSLPRRVISFASTAGYPGIFILMLLEAAALPIPSEIILPFAGYLVYMGELGFWPLVFVSTIAALLGSFVDYCLGWKLGSALLSDPSKIPYVNANHMSRVQNWFNRYGPMAVGLLRLVPAARVLISFPAGAYRMSAKKFGLYTLLGCLPWNITLLYLGWSLGTSWDSVVGAFRYINLIVYAALIILAFLIAFKVLSARRR